MPKSLTAVVPGAMLLAGVLGLSAARNQTDAPLRVPLDQIADSLQGLPGKDFPVSPEERRAAGVSTLLMRFYPSPEQLRFSLYIGYYESQGQGRSIHSPKNCLPGAGWEPLSADTAVVRSVAGGPGVTVNRYVLAKGTNRALVYYWYQGRGRVSWNELRVKWELFRDKARYGRSEEALVRIVVPMRGKESEADATARQVAAEILPQLDQALPVPVRP